MLLLLASVLLMRVKAMTNVDLNDIVSLTALYLFLILGDITVVPGSCTSGTTSSPHSLTHQQETVIHSVRHSDIQ
jgi:hypothetical protein